MLFKKGFLNMSQLALSKLHPLHNEHSRFKQMAILMLFAKIDIVKMI